MLDPDFKDRWIAALTDGSYKQGKGYLRNSDDEFCCLGVAADLFSQESNWAWSNKVAISLFDDKTVQAILNTVDEFIPCSTQYLPQELRNALGLSPTDCFILAAKNDGSGPYKNNRQTFAQIAEYIKENL